MHDRNVDVALLTRVEGEGALHLAVTDGKVTDVELRIFEPPRYFEGLLRGRGHLEPVDITARICGICPVAYQMTAAHAIEAACGVSVGDDVRALRRLLYCGEWIQSHVLHVVLLHAPDFLGYPSGLAMARDHRDEVEAALRLKKLGNDIMAAIGGRSVHPVGARVGGFWRAPDRSVLRALLPELAWAEDAAERLTRWVAELPVPDLERDVVHLALRHPVDYPMNEGAISTSDGEVLPAEALESLVTQRQVAHSHALHGHLSDGRTYAVGAVSRFNLNADRLPPRVRSVARQVGCVAPVRNPFRSIVVRSLEVMFAVEEARRLVETYVPPDPPYMEVAPRAGIGCWATEAPRGTLYHRYELDDDGTITAASLIPPTSQLQALIEDDVRRYATGHLDLPDDRLAVECERVVRSYDPCISCATHFLRFSVERRPHD